MTQFQQRGKGRSEQVRDLTDASAPSAVKLIVCVCACRGRCMCVFLLRLLYPCVALTYYAGRCPSRACPCCARDCSTISYNCPHSRRQRLFFAQSHASHVECFTERLRTRASCHHHHFSLDLHLAHTHTHTDTHTLGHKHTDAAKAQAPPIIAARHPSPPRCAHCHCRPASPVRRRSCVRCV